MARLAKGLVARKTNQRDRRKGRCDRRNVECQSEIENGREMERRGREKGKGTERNGMEAGGRNKRKEIRGKNGIKEGRKKRQIS